MSHFAKLDENNVVTHVIVGDNNLPNEGYDWVISRIGGRWVQTSYNGNFRKRFAGVGYAYNEELDAFVMPKPFESWVLDQETVDWVAPIPYPEDGLGYDWDEENGSWKIIMDQPAPEGSLDETLYWDEESQTWVVQ